LPEFISVSPLGEQTQPQATSVSDQYDYSWAGFWQPVTTLAMVGFSVGFMALTVIGTAIGLSRSGGKSVSNNLSKLLFSALCGLYLLNSGIFSDDSAVPSPTPAP